MTNTQLDPEMELEAQQLANYEDELRELAEEVKAQDEYFEEHKEELIEWQKKMDEVMANEANNTQWILLKKYELENFRLWSTYKSEDEIWDDDDWCSIVKNLEYGSFFTNLHINLNKFSDWTWSVSVRLRKDWFYFDINKHGFDDYQEAIDCLNSITPLLYDLQAWNIQ